MLKAPQLFLVFAFCHTLFLSLALWIIVFFCVYSLFIVIGSFGLSLFFSFVLLIFDSFCHWIVLSLGQCYSLFCHWMPFHWANVILSFGHWVSFVIGPSELWLFLSFALFCHWLYLVIRSLLSLALLVFGSYCHSFFCHWLFPSLALFAIVFFVVFVGSFLSLALLIIDSFCHWLFLSLSLFVIESFHFYSFFHWLFLPLALFVIVYRSVIIRLRATILAKTPKSYIRTQLNQFLSSSVITALFKSMKEIEFCENITSFLLNWIYCFNASCWILMNS